MRGVVKWGDGWVGWRWVRGGALALPLTAAICPRTSRTDLPMLLLLVLLHLSNVHLQKSSQLKCADYISPLCLSEMFGFDSI